MVADFRNKKVQERVSHSHASSIQAAHRWRAKLPVAKAVNTVRRKEPLLQQLIDGGSQQTRVDAVERGVTRGKSVAMPSGRQQPGTAKQSSYSSSCSLIFPARSIKHHRLARYIPMAVRLCCCHCRSGVSVDSNEFSVRLLLQSCPNHTEGLSGLFGAC
ncbi:hypothetical protein LZ30DRAFT_473694 [Colletotrichum cereale]|nr:hypothetical protein LZ30DRAFT_473694 [Colletotrichum cereale]